MRKTFRVNLRLFQYEVVENIKGVGEVIEQDTLDYIPNLEKLKPAYVVHGDDWKPGIQIKLDKKSLIN